MFLCQFVFKFQQKVLRIEGNIYFKVTDCKLNKKNKFVKMVRIYYSEIVILCDVPIQIKAVKTEFNVPAQM